MAYAHAQGIRGVAFTIKFDYRFDTNGFFDDPDARAALEAAADLWENVILDEFDDVPAGTTLDIRNPVTSASETVVLSSAVDDIIVFVGATQLSGNVLGFAGPDGVNAAGDVFAARISSDFRGTGPVTDFEPWAGTITFDADTNWNFGDAPLAQSQSDFISVAAHEIGHILGIGIAGAFDRWIINDVFTGPNAQAVTNGAGIPVESDGAHVVDGYAGETVLMDPTLTQGTSKTVTQFDKALLADIGYEIAGFTAQGFTPAIATEGAERIFGTETADVINGLGGNDTLQGAGGDDELRGGSGDDVFFGQSGTDTFVVAAGDGQNTIADFDLSSEKVRLIDSGFASAAAAAAAVTKVASNVSQLTFEDGTTVRIFHTSQSGTPLNASHFEVDAIEESQPEPPQPTNSAPTGNVFIEGIPEVGNTLSADTSTIADADGLGAFSYVWLRDGVVVSGETGTSFVLSEDDEGARLQVRVTYTDGEGTTHSLTSDRTEVIEAAPVTAEDTNSGDQGAGEDTGGNDANGEDQGSGDTTGGQGTDSGDQDTNQNTSEGETQDTPSDTPLPDVAETPTDQTPDDGGTPPQDENDNEPEAPATAVVYVIDPTSGPFEINDFNLNKDQLDFSAFIRADVTEAVLNASGTNGATLRFFDGTVVTINGPGVTGATIVHADIVVSGSNSAALGTITIEGGDQVGSTLTATIGEISDGDGVFEDTFALQWYRGDSQIDGATGTTYVLSDDDIGQVLTVKLTYTDLYGRTETVTSEDFSVGDGSEAGGEGDGDTNGNASDGENGGTGSDDDTDRQNGGDGDGVTSGDGNDGASDAGDGTDDSGADDSSDGGDGTGSSGADDDSDDGGRNDDGGNDTPVTATPFNDIFAARAGMSSIDGGDGTDTVVLTGSQSDYTLVIGPDTVTVTDKRSDGLGTLELTNIEQIDFGTALASGADAGPLDITQFNGFSDLTEEEFGAFVEMYIAYFNRAPDALGLAFWATAYARGTTLEEMAELFLDQDETRDAYPEDLLTVRFVAEVYNNVLGRNPDLEGLQFWREALDSGQVGHDEFILEVLGGVDAQPPSNASEAFVSQQRADQDFLQQKTDIGMLFAVERGMSDVADAASIMGLLDGSDESLQSAVAAIEAAYSDALDPEDGDFLMPLVGVLDSTFDV